MIHHIIPLGELHLHQDTSSCTCHPYVGSPDMDNNVYIVHYHQEETSDEEEREDDENNTETGSFDIHMN